MIKVYVMQTCPDCTAIKLQAADDPRFEIIDIGEHVRNLKQFLTIRDSEPAFEAIRQKGSVGIPCFVLEDGRITFSLEEANLTLDNATTAEAETPSFCSLDGKGC